MGLARVRLRPSLASSRTAPLLLPREKLLDVLAAELGTFHDGMADARKHLPEPETDLTLPDLLGTTLDPFGRLVHLGLVGRPRRPARESQGREESWSNPHPAKSPCHDAPPSERLPNKSMLPPPRPPSRCRTESRASVPTSPTPRQIERDAIPNWRSTNGGPAPILYVAHHA